MAFADMLAQVKTHAVDAGNAVTPLILDVAVGAPAAKEDRSVRIFYGGEAEPERMAAGLTLKSQMVGERIVVVLSIKLSNLSLQETEQVETELYNYKHELRTRILGDAQLTGQSTDLVMTLAEPDYVEIGTSRYRVLTTEIVAEFVEYTIAQ